MLPETGTNVSVPGKCMKFKVQIVVESESGNPTLIQEILQFEKENLLPGNLGLTLEQGKGLLLALEIGNGR